MFDSIKEKVEAVKDKVSNWNWRKGVQSFFEKCRWFNITLTTAFNIKTTIHWSVPLFIMFLLFFVDPFQAGIATIAFLSVVPHEYGHAIAARWYGIKTSGIVLYPLGGVAMLVPNKEVRLERWRELVVAAAGPAVSLGLAILGFGMMMLHGMPAEPTTTSVGLWFWLGAVNLVMFLFNMLPAFPMDGGRMLRAIINLFTNHVQATQYAYYCSVFFCILMGMYGLWIGSMMLPFTMLIVHFLARMELLSVRNQAAIEAAAQEVPLEIEPEKKPE